MVFRRDHKPEYQRQLGALRQQLGGDEGQEPQPTVDAPYVDQQRADAGYGAPVRDAATGGREVGYTFGAYNNPAAPAPVAEPAAPAIPDIDAQTSVVSRDTTWKGDLDTKGSIHVHGRVEGTITAAREVYVAEDAEVEATILAATVIIAGKVQGEVRCSSRFEMLPSGRVDGNIQAPSLVIHEGASISGQFRMGGGESSADARVSSVMGRRSARGTA